MCLILQPPEVIPKEDSHQLVYADIPSISGPHHRVIQQPLLTLDDDKVEYAEVKSQNIVTSSTIIAGEKCTSIG